MILASPAHAATSASSVPVGVTLGVEEEYHVIDVGTLDLRDDPALNDSAVRGRLGERVDAEIATTQLEIATGVCVTLADVRAELRAARREAAAATAAAGAAILAASTHPSACWSEQRLTSRPRYLGLLERWGVLALQQVICGCHVHVGVPDEDTAVAVMDHVRPYLPVLLAMTGSSPFHEGVDTGYDSYRTQWFARWPITGAPELLGDSARYRSTVEELRMAGAIDDASNLYWDVRPSERYPTLEFRIADVCTDLDDVVLHAALVRSLTRVLSARAQTGVQPPRLRPEVLRAARWRAARYGLGDRLLDVAQRELVPAPLAVRGLLSELREDLIDHAEWEEVEYLAEQLQARGTSATRQRAVLHRTGDLTAVTAFLAERTLAACGGAGGRNTEAPPRPVATA